MHFDVLDRLQGNPMLLRKARLLTLEFDLHVGTGGYRFSVRDGAVALAPHAAHGPAAPAAFTIRAPEAAWREFADAARRPQFHDLIALVECGHATVSGDLLPFFRNLFVVKGLLAAAFRGEAAW